MENIFLENKYTKWYYNIISSAKSKIRNRTAGVYELHHIIPKSLNKDISNLKINPDNGVLLTLREHFICHLLLNKMCADHKHKIKMAYAFHKLGMRLIKHNLINSRYYESIRIQHASCVSDRHKGKILTQETKDKISISKTGIKIHRTSEHNSKISESQKGKPRYYARGENHFNSKGPILQLDLNGNVVGEYCGLRDILDSGFTKDVYYAISGRQKTHRGYKWKWKNEYENND